MKTAKRAKDRRSVIIERHEFKPQEECGIFGMACKESRDIAQDIYFGLYALQHRGQESAGIAVQYECRKVSYSKKMGLVSEVFPQRRLSEFPSARTGVGHVRYSTTGSSNVANAQPVVFYGRYGRTAVAHNGNIVNCDRIKSRMIKNGHIFQCSIDSEVIAALINQYSEESLEAGVKKACGEIVGAFSILIMADDKLIALRDPLGLKPLCMGKLNDDIIFSSESCAIDALGGTEIRDIMPGEIVTVEKDLTVRSTMLDGVIKRRSCIFEYVYLARSDSRIDGVNVYDARYECGRMLASLCKIDADAVAGVPDSAIVSARGYSEVSGIPYTDALSKNRYIGRTFIQPSQSMRENSVKVKLNAIKANIMGKRLILIDDSIVRGTTSRKIVQLLRDNGAAEVHMVIASPVVAFPCFFGVDMESKDKLIGGHQGSDAICKAIGADSLHYMPMELMVKACGGQKSDFCTACFDGDYPLDLSDYNLDKFVLEL
ncbi:MAG: amidophosphoribosyltransferase [Clostridiales bacterium]|jgi:amidophosphoribosyltransferase|nr:amidophosphoribosyltransferase [Clostridiales bacterium]